MECPSIAPPGRARPNDPLDAEFGQEHGDHTRSAPDGALTPPRAASQPDLEVN